MMKTKKKMKTAVNNFVYCYKKGVKSFSEIYIPESVISVDVSGNPLLSSFEGLASFPQMTTLKANETRISTFKGAQTQTSLVNLSLLNTPLAKEKHLIIMSLLTFGLTLQNVNGKLVLPEMRTLAIKIRSKVLPYLERGYLLSSVDPELKVHFPGSQRDIIVDLELDEFLEKEKLISENDKKIQEMKKKILLLQKEKRENKLAKVDKKQLIESFLSPSPKKAKKSTDSNKSNKTQKNEAKQNQKTTNTISPPIRSTKQKPVSTVKKNQTKSQPKNSTNSSSNSKKQADQFPSENKLNGKEKLTDSNKEEEEEDHIVDANQNEEKEENIFNFSEDEAKEEEELIDMNKKPKNVLPTSNNFPDDDQLVDTGNDSLQQQTNSNLGQEVDADLYNDLIGDNEGNENEFIEEENQNELQNKEDNNANSNIENENDQAYSDKIEFKENDNEDVNNIFNFSDEEDEEEDSPDVAAMKLDMNTPKKKFEIHQNVSDDDIMIDFNDGEDQLQPNNEEEEL